MQTSFVQKVVVVVGLVAAASCGGDGTFNPSSPGGTPIDQLSAAQAMALCREELTYERMFSSIETLCRLDGLRAVGLAGSPSSTDAELQAFCKVGYDACKRDPPPTVSETDAEIAQICTTAMATASFCPATVDQYSACINERADAARRLVVPCAQLTQAKILEISTSMEGPACRAFGAVCPGLAASEAMMSDLKGVGAR